MNTITSDNPIRIMLVDDSVVIRGLFNRILSQDPLLKIAASASDGQMAINHLKRHDIEVIVLDIEMPVMDGLTALPVLLKEKPDVQIIIASTLTRRNAEISIRALTNGAKDYISKPENAKELHENSFQSEFINKIKALGEYRRKKLKNPNDITILKKTNTNSVEQNTYKKNNVKSIAPIQHLKNELYQLRQSIISKPDIIAIGSSTGGPQALGALLKSLSKEITLPILITQHMPPTFTSILATHLTKHTDINCKEAQDGDIIEKQKAYIAPGGKHMIVELTNNQKRIRIIDTPPENYCKPSIDLMLQNLPELYGPHVLTIILTGMGCDGLKGSTHIVKNGGTIFAQDEASSIVWGMPGAVALAGLCSAVIPIHEMSSQIHSLIFRSVA